MYLTWYPNTNTSHRTMASTTRRGGSWRPFRFCQYACVDDWGGYL